MLFRRKRAQKTLESHGGSDPGACPRFGGDQKNEKPQQGDLNAVMAPRAGEWFAEDLAIGLKKGEIQGSRQIQ